jgi:hypothetical protein
VEINKEQEVLFGCLITLEQSRQHYGDTLLRLTQHWLRIGLVALAAGGAFATLGIVAYLAHLQSSATALIDSARGIRTKSDAEREIVAWTKRSGKDFWGESDHPGGDHNYDAQIVNLPVARLRLVEPTGVTVSITMRNDELRCVTVIESTGWYPVASVWIQEWFNGSMPNQFRVGSSRKPSVATVEFPSSMPEALRRRGFAFNTKCLVETNGCKTAEDIFPGVWQLKSVVSPE